MGVGALKARILEILERVARCGPITLDELTQKTGISRSAIFRSLKSLEQSGWIRLRLDGRRYVPTCKIEKHFEPRVEPRSEVDELVPLVACAIEPKRIRARIFLQRTTTAMELVDDSQYGASDSSDSEDVIHFCHLILNSLQHLGICVGSPNFTFEKAPIMETIIQDITTNGFSIVNENSLLFIPLIYSSKEFLLICLSRKDYGPINAEAGADLYVKFRENKTKEIIRFKNLRT